MKDRNLKEISEMLSCIDDEELIEKFLTEMLTPSEIDTLVLRWELLKMLDEGFSQREISKTLRVSLCKITRGSRELKKQDSAVKKILKQLDLIKSGEKISGGVK